MRPVTPHHGTEGSAPSTPSYILDLLLLPAILALLLLSLKKPATDC